MVAIVPKSKFKFKAPPMAHQLVGLRRAWPLKEFAYFWEMGIGKTYEAINLAAARYKAGQIDACVIICPTSIKSIWYNDIEYDNPEDECEIKKFCPVDYSAWVYESGDKPVNWIREKKSELKFFILGVESLSIERGQSMNALDYFRRFHKFMCVIDESSRIKNWKAKRTENVILVGGWADYRLILTGTPVTQGLEDLYGQFKFLNENIIGCKNYFVFRNKYCVMGGWKNKIILGYQFQDHLLDKITPYVDCRTKKECLDLPEQVYPPPIIVQPTNEQKRVMKQLKDEFSMEDQGKEITISTILERTLRYQQVIGGTFPFEENGEYDTQPISGGNPKLDAILAYIEELSHGTKCIIWARFVPEIRYIIQALGDRWGEESVLGFYGATDKAQRPINSQAFQQDPKKRFIVSNQTVGGYGQTWTAATYALYYSNTFSYEDRYQSESRPHRKGQLYSVTYQDFEMAVPHDRMILTAVRKKRNLAKEVEESWT
ncbi:hypothetical protein LCGC14_0739880 [marine sediment metagenome]|uniref:Helicase ATP-binding domain-containing protein n=1 Tax=marine sediment metagenome TaxID=412755 RepID=A0A0F9QS31_9ZZZZ